MSSQEVNQEHVDRITTGVEYKQDAHVNIMYSNMLSGMAVT